MRKAVITRTINFTMCEVMSINVETKEVSNILIPYSGNKKDDAKILEEIKKSYEGNDVLVQIVKKEEIEQLYSMYEEDFIKYATPISDRTEKPNSI